MFALPCDGALVMFMAKALVGIGLLLPHDAALCFIAIKTCVEQAQILLYANACGFEQGFFQRPHLQSIAQRLGSHKVVRVFLGAQTRFDDGWAYGAWIRLNVYAQRVRCLAANDGNVTLAVAEVELPMGEVTQIRFAMRVVFKVQICTSRQAHTAAQPSMRILMQCHTTLGKV